MLSFKNSTLIITAIAAGICFYFLFRSCSDDSGMPLPTVISPAVLEKKAAQEEIRFRKTIDSLQNKAKNLDKKLAQTAVLLTESKQRFRQLQARLNQRVFAGQNADTSVLNTACDSLQDELIAWEEAGNEKDSLYDAVISEQNEKIVLKDSVISVQQVQYLSLKNNFQQGLEQYQLLANNNKQLQKEVKRQRLKNKWLPLVSMIAGGIVTSYLLKH